MPAPESDGGRQAVPGVTILRKAGLTAITAGLTYAITAIVDRPNIAGLNLSILIGGVTLIVQFLNDFERRLQIVERKQQEHTEQVERMVDSRFHKINEATELFSLVETSTMRADDVTALVRHSTRIAPTSPTLVRNLAHLQIQRTSDLLKVLSEGADLIYEGEDREWLLGLTDHAERSMDAVSLTTVDASSKGLLEGDSFWTSDLGQRYLDAQRQATQRGVVIRRILVLDQPTPDDTDDLAKLCELHRAAGISIRVLDPPSVPRVRRHALLDFIVFDQVLSYETTRASSVDNSATAIVATTRLVLRPALVKERMRWFDELWACAQEVP